MDGFSDLALRLEQINATHNVAGFDCQNVLLNTFLQDKALKEQRSDISRTYLLIGTSHDGSEAIIGYFALEADSYYGPSFEIGTSRPIPVIDITNLARHRALKGKKLAAP